MPISFLLSALWSGLKGLGSRLLKPKSSKDNKLLNDDSFRQTNIFSKTKNQIIIIKNSYSIVVIIGFIQQIQIMIFFPDSSCGITHLNSAHIFPFFPIIFNN